MYIIIVYVHRFIGNYLIPLTPWIKLLCLNYVLVLQDNYLSQPFRQLANCFLFIFPTLLTNFKDPTQNWGLRPCNVGRVTYNSCSLYSFTSKLEKNISSQVVQLYETTNESNKNLLFNVNVSLIVI